MSSEPTKQADAASVIPPDHDCEKEGCDAVREFARGRDLEWEVRHVKSSLYKGRGKTPEAALRDLRDSFALGVKAAREDLEREEGRVAKLTELLADTVDAFDD